MDIEIEFELSKQDLKEIVRYQLYRHSPNRDRHIGLMIICAMLGIWAIIAVIIGELDWIIPLSAGCLGFLGVIVTTPKRVLHALQKTPFYQGKIRVSMNDAGTHYIYTTGDSNTQWTGYVRFHETKNLFLLFVSDVMFRPIPKRVLSADQISQLRQILQSAVSSPAK